MSLKHPENNAVAGVSSYIWRNASNGKLNSLIKNREDEWIGNRINIYCLYKSDSNSCGTWKLKMKAKIKVFHARKIKIEQDHLFNYDEKKNLQTKQQISNKCLE